MLTEQKELLHNLLSDSSPHILVFLAEQYGLRRIPGLSKEALIERIMHHLLEDDLQLLMDNLIAARFGSLPVEQLVDMALQHADSKQKPRLDQISPAEAILIEGGPSRWVYTMRGHDVVIDLERRHLTCDCHFFRFASRQQALCKHLATALKLLPEVYARETLIDLLVSRQYGGPQTPRWHFERRPAA
jgi:hypothetical protein